MSEHDWFRDNLDLYLAGALTQDEVARLDQHAADCAACAQELARQRLRDQQLGRLCAPVHFAGDWDQRVQARWRKSQRHVPTSVRWALAAAAVLLIGAVGAAANALVQQGMIAFPGGELLQARGPESSIDDVGNIVALVDTSESAAEHRLAENYGDVLLNVKETHTGSVMLGAGANSNNGLVGSFVINERNLARNNLRGLNTDTYHLEGMRANKDGRGAGGMEHPSSLAIIVPEGGRVKTSLTGGIIGGKSQRGAEAGVPGSVTADDTVGIRAGDATKPPVNLEGFQRHKALGLESGDVAARKDRIATIEFDRAPTWGDAVNGKAIQDVTAFSRKQSEKSRDKNDDIRELAKQQSKESAPATNAPTSSPPVGFTEGTTPLVTQSDKSRARLFYDAEDASLAKMNELRAGVEYFRAPTANDGEAIKKGLKQLDDAMGKRSGRGTGVGEKDILAQKGERKPVAEGGPSDGAAGQPEPQAQVAQRKIIRTGDMEFEVSVFDDAVAQITKLIGAIPGAFVATVNSEKLANGKVKGAVVVRVPPEGLDKFVLDLRQALGKTGELKSQKIGSSDVTKQYTDIESRLRAARTMEERLLAIIKNGKGEVKDLIAAERELGVWRTRIEEMEGEIRYYNNQVGLSTLTITVYEKEIRAAAEMVITEHVTMKIEADDVEKSLQTALTAVTEAKGRVTKSDLKQHAAGQLEATLTFQVAPAQAGAVKEKLKTLGIVTHHDAQRQQQAEGGSAPTGDIIRSRSDDVRFDVTLYNVANIQPREAYVLQLVVTDVPAEYRKLLDGVSAAKGQVRVSQLDEKDRTNTFAQLDFDVPAGQRELFDKVVAGLGEIVSRNTTRAGPGETATDRKVGYRLTLKSEASVPPRETLTLNVYSLDVPAAYRKLQDAAAQLKGQVRALNLNEQDRTNVTAQFDVDVLRVDMAALEKLLDEAGEVASRSTSRVQPGEVASDRKVGYRLTLRNQIPPRETLDLNLEVADVERTAMSLAAAVQGVKGRVTAWEGTQDASGKAVVIQLFDVPFSAKELITDQIKAIGKVRGQKIAQNLQAPEGKLATAHINVRLTNVTPIVPSDEGLWPQVRRSLGYAFTLLSVSLMFLIVGVSVLLPWALLGWLGFRLVRRIRNRRQTTPI